MEDTDLGFGPLQQIKVLKEIRDELKKLNENLSQPAKPKAEKPKVEKAVSKAAVETR
jgi:BRCT domain type II-containing protein